MGIHHFRIEVLPFDDETEYCRLLEEDSKEDSEEPRYWREQPDPSGLQQLRSLFPIDKTWGPCEEFLSTNGSWQSDLRIWHFDDDLNDVSYIVIRISVFEDFVTLISDLAKIAQRFGWFIGIPNSGRVIPPLPELLLEHLRTCSASRFARNPGGTLAEIAREITENKDRGTSN
jgi:hypothetical protein